MADSLRYRWTGVAWEPLARLRARCQKAFAIGQYADLEIVEERSPESHGHFMASVTRAWRNLPEPYAERFGDDEKKGTEALRKWCLIKAGFRNERTYVAQSPEAAQAMAMFIGPLDEFAVIVADGNLVTVLTAKTQKLRRNSDDGMDKKEFEASKEAVLRICAEMIGTDVATLAAQDAPSITPAHSPASERQKERVE